MMIMMVGGTEAEMPFWGGGRLDYSLRACLSKGVFFLFFFFIGMACTLSLGGQQKKRCSFLVS